jgi:hypothetical protein
MMKKDAKAATCPYEPNVYAWVLKRVRKVKSFQVKGKLGIFKLKFNEFMVA